MDKIEEKGKKGNTKRSTVTKYIYPHLILRDTLGSENRHDAKSVTLSLSPHHTSRSTETTRFAAAAAGATLAFYSPPRNSHLGAQRMEGAA
jgi:hypothetical protein